MDSGGLGEPGSRSQVVFAVTVAMLACSTIFVFFRMVSRIGIVKRVYLDDYFIILAWVGCWSVVPIESLER